MFCNHCGSKVQEGMKFCPVCGKEMETGKVDHGSGTIFTPSDSNQIPHLEKENSKFEKKEKRKITKKTTKKVPTKGRRIRNIIIAILAVLLVLGIGGTVFYISSAARNVKTEIEKGNYETAKRLYSRKVEDNFIQKIMLRSIAKGDCKSLLEDFRSGKLSYDNALGKISGYQSLGDEELETYFSGQADILENLNDSMEAYVKAEEYYNEGNYTKAMEAYALVAEDDDNYKDAQSKLTTCVDNYKKEILGKTDNPGDIEGYKSAIDTIEIAVNVVPDDSDLKSRLTELQDEYAELLKSEALTNGTQYIKDGKYQEIFELIDMAMANNEGDTELENLRKTAEDEFVSKVQSTVDTYLEQDEYEEAGKYLESAVKILDSNTTLNELSAKVKDNQPTKLCDMKITESSRFEAGKDISVMEDSIGNVYSPGNLYKLSPDYGGNGFATFYLNGKYTRLRGTVAVADDSEESKSGKISVYDENGSILYTSGDMSRMTAPKEVQADLTGVEWITISAENVDGYSFRGFISDFLLYKD